MYVNTTTKKALFIAGLLLTIPFLHAVAGSPSGPGGDVGAPIDGGISLLVAAGIGYGAKKVRDARKAKKSDDNKDDAAGI